MITTIINRIKRFAEANPADADQQVDIGRVLPGYTPPVERGTNVEDAPAQAESPAEERATKQTSDTLVLTDEVVSDEEAMQNTAWMKRDLDRLYAAWDIAKAAPHKMKPVARANHDLKGMATIYGYPSIERLSVSLEKLLSSETVEANLALVNLHVEACRAAFAQGIRGEGSDTVADSVCDALEAQVDRAVG
ncbi:MAG: Hpt domain-containing protein [Pseudomonadota bacterium]